MKKHRKIPQKSLQTSSVNFDDFSKLKIWHLTWFILYEMGVEVTKIILSKPFQNIFRRISSNLDLAISRGTSPLSSFVSNYFSKFQPMQYIEQTEYNQQIAENIDIYSLLQLIMNNKRRRENLSKCPKLPGCPKLPRLTVCIKVVKSRILFQIFGQMQVLLMQSEKMINLMA